MEFHQFRPTYSDLSLCLYYFQSSRQKTYIGSSKKNVKNILKKDCNQQIAHEKSTKTKWCSNQLEKTRVRFYFILLRYTKK